MKTTRIIFLCLSTEWKTPTNLTYVHQLWTVLSLLCYLLAGWLAAETLRIVIFMSYETGLFLDIKRMLSWFKNKKLGRAQAVLSRHINQQAVQRVKAPFRPAHERTAYCQVAYLIPLHGNKPQHAEMTPVVTHDISTGGISVVHHDTIDCDRVLLGLPTDADFNYLKCRVEHCTRLSPEFVQIGLRAEEIANVTFRKFTDADAKRKFEKRMKSACKQETVKGILEYWGDPKD